MDRATYLAYKRLRIVRRQARVIRVQRVIIAALLVGLVLSLFLQPATAVKEQAPTVKPVEVTGIAEPAVASVIKDDAPLIEEPHDLVYAGCFKLTAYCSCKSCCGKTPDDPAYGITRSGTHVEAGRTIAVDSSVIPLGTEVIIDGHAYVAEDTGAAIKGNRIDVYFDSHQEALNFGVQYADVYIKE